MFLKYSVKVNKFIHSTSIFLLPQLHFHILSWIFLLIFKLSLDTIIWLCSVFAGWVRQLSGYLLRDFLVLSASTPYTNTNPSSAPLYSKSPSHLTTLKFVYILNTQREWARAMYSDIFNVYLYLLIISHVIVIITIISECLS